MIINKKTKGFQTFNDIEIENEVHNSNALEFYQIEDYSDLYDKIIKKNYQDLEFIEDHNGNLIDVNIIEFPKPTLMEQREAAYAGDMLIQWESEEITVDVANKKYYDYFAEGNEKANQLQQLIIEAKQSIRERYPE